MVFNTISVGTAVTPTVIETYFSHYLNRKPLRQKPTAHISYHEGVNLIRQFLAYASHHTVEDIQGFTSQWVPSPRWVKVDEVDIPQKCLSGAADAVVAQLGPHGVDKVGGEKWWQWRRVGNVLKAEWIEMRRDFYRRKGDKGKRIMLYVHGGAYFFGSVDEHRYQLQRHARKLEARVFARGYSRYRLAPQFPFPCGLFDCLAAYLYLLTVQDPSEIVLVGDSAGGGMIVSILVILRDRGLPLPAGAILISPWVDLTHSFPSVAGDGSLDFIPTHGFLQRPSASWPPPNTDDMEEIAMHAVEQVAGEGLPRKSTNAERREVRNSAVQDFSADHALENLHPKYNADNPAGTEGAGERPGNTIPGAGHNLSIMIGGKLVDIKDQIQMYTTNQLISHPLVSPVLQPSLGGLPPLLIMTGGGEVLRDEQIYLAHKAAHPSQYPPGGAYLDEYPESRDLIAKWKPTDVQLQVWDDLCHVAPTLSFTRPAKFMYRSIAQFGAWALARAQKTEIEIMDDDEMSLISVGSDTESESDFDNPKQKKSIIKNGVAQGEASAKDQVGKAGDALPAFKDHMIRQRVDRHGHIFLLDPPSSMPALQMSANEVGVIKPGPVGKWLSAKSQWDQKYAREKRKVQKQRAKEMAKGFQGFGNDDVPPPSALAGRRGLSMPKEEKKKKSWGMSMWSLWGSSHDENTIQREEKADKEINTTTVSQDDGANARPAGAGRVNKTRSRSRRRGVTDAGQTSYIGKPKIDENTPAVELDRRRNEQSLYSQANGHPTYPTHLAPSIILSSPPDENSENAKAVPLPASPGERPYAGPGKAFPFKLGRRLDNKDANASTITLASQAGVVSPKGDEESKQLGDSTSLSSPDRNTENAIAVPLPASPGERPSVGPDKAFPFKLGRHQGSLNIEGANASTVTLMSQAGVVLPKGDDTGRHFGDSLDNQEEHSIEAQENNDRQRTIEPVEDAHGEQADGVDHYDLRNKLPLEGENGNELANNAVGPEERRGTLEDAKGVLHHGPGVAGGLGEKDDEGKGEGGVTRPGIDRSETASLD
ncbi:MAG: hypothetical protein ASARMPRED_000033 [Alectoria sarmentosa]|nr:MAG: hypothetical protein ASARMPRED_000033 [Alectoria sarmentosa]